jgi:hypothetical protein
MHIEVADAVGRDRSGDVDVRGDGSPPLPETLAGIVATWRGKSVVLTVRPMARFMAWSRGNIALGMFGGAVAEVEGTHIVLKNGVENPAPRISRSLFEAAQLHLGVVAATIAPLSVDSTDVATVARAARGADPVLIYSLFAGLWSYSWVCTPVTACCSLKVDEAKLSSRGNTRTKGKDDGTGAE